MKIDLNVYAVNRPFIQEYYRNNVDKNVGFAVSILSSSTHCPCIAMAFYLAEDIGYTPELINIINNLIKFYGYTEIKNQKEGSPFLKGLT